MVLNPYTLFILDLQDRVSPERDCGHTMEEFGTFITKLNSIDCIALAPVEIFIVELGL